LYRLLIVDDEYWIRKRLISTVNWNELGIGEIYEAEDGKQALGICIEHEPDIIVTDINMPELSGIELMQALNESALYPRIILISGYNEFEYARSALKLGAVDYLLKPVDENELVKIVKNCIEDLESLKKEKELMNALEKSSGEIRKRVIADLLFGKIKNPDYSLLHLGHIGIDFPYSSAVCLITRASAVAKPDKNDYVEETLISFSIANTMEDVLSPLFGHCFILQMEDMNIAVLFSEKEGGDLKQLLKEAIDSLESRLKQQIHVDIVFGLGDVVSDVLELHHSYKTAKHFINIFNYNDWKNVLEYGDKYQSDYFDLQNVYCDYNLNAITADIRNCDSASALAGLKVLVDDFIAHRAGNPTPLQIKLFFINVMNTLFKSCLVSSPPSEELLNVCIDSLEEVGTFLTSEKLTANLQRIVDFLIAQYSAFIGNKRHWLIDRITEYIHENYSAPLTMQDVANNFFLNPSYFCKLFKEETGYTFTHYLMKLRVDKAKDLMTMSTQKLYDIAAAVGYGNVQYFSTIFKEIEGVTPSQYRTEH
jgi:two-component system response regulator YesN